MKICVRCGKEFSRRDSLLRHLSKNKQCTVKFLDVDCDMVIKNYQKYYDEYLGLLSVLTPNNHNPGATTTFQSQSPPPIITNDLDIREDLNSVIKCNFCYTKFTHYNNLHRHKKKYCKKLKLREENDDKMKKLYNLLVKQKDWEIEKTKEELEKNQKERENDKEEIAKLQKELNEIRQQLGTNNPNIMMNNSNDNHLFNTYNTTNSNSNNTTNNVIINIHDYGKEDYSKITEEECKQLIEHDFNIILKFVELVHIDNPENMNIYIASLKEKYAMIFSNQEWTAVNRIEFIKKLMMEKSQILYDLIDKYEKRINTSKVTRIRKVINYSLSDMEDSEKLAEDLQLLFYNNNNKVKKNYETRYGKNMKTR